MMTRTAASGRGRSTRAATAGAGRGSRRGTGGPSDGEVVGAWRAFLAALPDELAASPNAALALALAAEIDGENSATSKAENGRVLFVLEKELRGLVPEEKKASGVDDLASRRDRRRSGRAAAAD